MRHTADPRGASGNHGTGARIRRLPELDLLASPEGEGGWTPPMPPMPKTAEPTDPPYLLRYTSDTKTEFRKCQNRRVKPSHFSLLRKKDVEKHTVRLFIYNGSGRYMMWLSDPTPIPLVCTLWSSHPAGVSHPFAFCQFSNSVRPYLAML